MSALKYALVLAAGMMAAPALALFGHAAELPPSIDMTQVLTDLHGQPIPDAATRARGDLSLDCQSCKPLTLGAAAAYSLCQNEPEQQQRANPAAEHQKYERCKLGSRLLNDAAAIVSDEDLKRIRAAVEARAQGLVVMRALDMLDAASAKGK